VTRRWIFGLQGWLVGALLAVGMAASLAILLVVLPTLESSVRGDRAKRDGEELARDVRAAGRDPGLTNTVTQDQLRELVTQLRAQTGAEVRVDVQGIFVNTSAQAPSQLTLLSQAPPLILNQGATFDDETAVATIAELYIDGQRQGTIAAAREVTGLAPELAIVRQRVIIAMIVVLGLRGANTGGWSYPVRASCDGRLLGFQMPAGKGDEDILQAGVPRGQAGQRSPVAGQPLQQAGGGDVRLADFQADAVLFTAHALDRRQFGQPRLGGELRAVATVNRKLDHMLG
jgi:hypothetical protein